MAMAMATALRLGTGLGGSMMIRALQGLYGNVADFSLFIDRHLAQMKTSDNATIERSGRVLEGCKTGFGIGYISPVIIIAAGQIILGNPLNAAIEVASAAIFANPMAMTCAAVGAVFYGYNALNETEKRVLWETLAEGLQIGIELIKSIIGFAIRTLGDLLNSAELAQLRRWVRQAAESFGRQLGDVTRALADRLTDGCATAAAGTKRAAARAAALTAAGTGVVARGTAAAASATRRNLAGMPGDGRRIVASLIKPKPGARTDSTPPSRSE